MGINMHELSILDAIEGDVITLMVIGHLSEVNVFI